jgi:membrane associated rhomboid family serine protease
MLEDRDYMRQPAYDDGPGWGRLLKTHNWSWTVVLLAVNILVYVVECALSPKPVLPQVYNLNILFSYLGQWLTPNVPFFNDNLALSLDGLKHGCVWQLLTYQFMHAGLLHIFFNLWVIYVFGRILEDVLGGRNFLLITLASGVLGGLFQVGAAAVWSQFDGPVVGASAGAFGLVAAFATLFPERVLTMLIYFIIPLRMRAKTLLVVSAGIAVGGMLFPAVFDRLMGGHVANAAHLGGMVMGVVYVRKIILGRWFRSQGLAHRPEPAFRANPIEESAPPKFWRAKAVSPAAELSADELLKTQVDPILDKISAHGLQSLTAREREILELASGKLAKR